MKSHIVIFLALLLAVAPIAEALTKQQQDRIDQLQKTGVEHLNKWKFSQAIALFKEILAINPADDTAARALKIAEQQAQEPYCRQAATAFQEGNYKRAVSIWENMLNTNPTDTRPVKLIAMTNGVFAIKARESMYLLAERLLKEKKYDEAIEKLDKILVQWPDDERAREMLGLAHKAVNEETIKRYFEQAEVYVQKGNYDLAIAEWRKVLELDEKREAALRAIAEAVRLKLENDYAEAKRFYEKGDYAASYDRYAEILMQNPTDLDVEKVLERLSRLLTVVKEIEDAGTVWEMIRKALSNYIAINGNVKAAIVAVRYAEQLEPDNTRITPVRDFIEREHIDIVRSMEPPSKNTDVIEQVLTAALNHIYEGRFDLAIQECDIVLILQPQNVMALKRLGSAYYATGNRGKAQEAWGKALKITPEDSELKQFILKTR